MKRSGLGILLITSALLVGCSDGEPSGDTDTLSDSSIDASPLCDVVDDLDDSCTRDADCVDLRHQIDCCGSLAAVGIASAARAEFDAAEAACRETYPTCRCLQQPTVADDGNAGPEELIRVACVSGRCETSFDVVELYCGPIPEDFDRSCAEDGDCFVALHQRDCCGTFIATGMSAAEEARFDEAEALCQQAYPACGCPSFPPEADDGTTAPDFEARAEVRCDAGLCVTTFAP